MGKKIRVLSVNPGSTSTKIALFDDHDEIFSATINHPSHEFKDFKEVQDQLAYRRDTIERTIKEKGYDMSGVDVFAGRGAGVYSVTGGTYELTDLFVEHASQGIPGQHPAQLASQICKQFADKYGKRAFTVNPPDVDEFDDVSRVCGLKGVYRESHIHALNQKEVALRFCKERGLKYEETNLVICHIGGGISITAHRNGRMIDSNDIIKGSGPMSPTRAGDMSYITIVNMAYSGEFTKKQLVDKLNRDGGLMDHLGTADGRDVERMVNEGDKYAELVIDGMIHQCAKYAGAMSVALKGDVKAIILTGGMSKWEDFTNKMKEYLSWITEVVVMPGEFEIEALAAGALRVMRGEEEAKTYTGVPVWNGFKLEEVQV